MKFVEITDKQDSINNLMKDISAIKKDLLKVFDAIENIDFAIKLLKAKNKKGA